MELHIDRGILPFNKNLTQEIIMKPLRYRFLGKLLNALDNPKHENIMCWDAEGKAVILKNLTLIEDKILQEEFEGLKLNSFLRQLNYYGFKRISGKVNVKIYCHEMFQRDRRDLIEMIKRNRKEPNAKNETSKYDHSIEQRVEFLLAELGALKTENLALRCYVKVLNRRLIDQADYIRIERQKYLNQTFTKPVLVGIQSASALNSTELYRPESRGHQEICLTKNLPFVVETPRINIPSMDPGEQYLNVDQSIDEESLDFDF